MNMLTKTQRKELESKAKALIKEEGGVVGAASKLGVTAVTLKGLLTDCRLYAPTVERLCEKLKVSFTKPEKKTPIKKAVSKKSSSKKSFAKKTAKKRPSKKAKAEKPAEAA